MRLPFTAALLPALLALALACGGNNAPRPVPITPQGPIRNDLSALSKLLSLPPGVTEARWQYATLGDASSFPPGPTDPMVWAWVRLDPSLSADLTALYGEPLTAVGPLTLSSDEVLVLPEPLRPLPNADGEFLIPAGRDYPSEQASKGSWNATIVREVGDGLWLRAISL